MIYLSKYALNLSKKRIFSLNKCMVQYNCPTRALQQVNNKLNDANRNYSTIKTTPTTSNGNRYNYNSKYKTYGALAAVSFVGLAGAIYFEVNKQKTYCKEKEDDESKEEAFNEDLAGKFVDGLPIYTEDDVKEHKTAEKRIWCTYKNGVYDITDFVDSHPGGRKILMAAGGQLEPFWEIYSVHLKNEVLEMLEELRIGNLKVDLSKKPNTNSNDPYRNDPKRHPLLKVLTVKPFNAESPSSLTGDSLVTPNELHFIRNHLPVPEIDLDSFRLEISNELSQQRHTFNLDDFKSKFPVYTIPVTIQCAGNRRKFMHEYEPVQGLMWESNAISTAEWTGVKLKDLLAYCGIDLKDERIKHVHFEGLDKDPTGAFYGASIPKEKVLDEYGDVLIAFQMNHKDIPLDHGFPLRAVVPGVIGARSVKWLNKIVLSDKESTSHWQVNDYKLLSPTIKDLKQANFSQIKAIQESSVLSAICEPRNGAKISTTHNETVIVKGYAFSGGGRAIDRVLVSTDNGKTWKDARLSSFDNPLYRSWAWTIWHLELDMPKDTANMEIICTAIDSEQNTQPETVKSIWNARGLMNNSWDRIKIELTK